MPLKLRRWGKTPPGVIHLKGYSEFIDFYFPHFHNQSILYGINALRKVRHENISATKTFWKEESLLIICEKTQFSGRRWGRKSVGPPVKLAPSGTTPGSTAAMDWVPVKQTTRLGWRTCYGRQQMVVWLPSNILIYQLAKHHWVCEWWHASSIRSSDYL